MSLTPKTPNEQEESSHNVGSNPSLNIVPQDDETTADELEPWVDYIARANHNASDLLTAGGITPWILRHSRAYWKRARMIAKHHGDHWTRLISVHRYTLPRALCSVVVVVVLGHTHLTHCEHLSTSMVQGRIEKSFHQVVIR